jgi:hypothetical protein
LGSDYLFKARIKLVGASIFRIAVICLIKVAKHLTLLGATCRVRPIARFIDAAAEDNLGLFRRRRQESNHLTLLRLTTHQRTWSLR